MPGAFFGLQCTAHRGRRICRPVLEQLESRQLLAFNLTISTDPSAGVTGVTSNGTTTFSATANDANLAVSDIDNALHAGNDVVVTSGATGIQAGNITTPNGFTHLFNNAVNASLTIATGSGAAPFFVGGIGVSGLQLMNTGGLVIQADAKANLSGTFVADTISVVSGSSSIAMAAGGLIQARTLSLTAKGNVGASSLPIETSVDSLTANSSTADGDQFITEANGLTSLGLNAGAGNITLHVTAGAVSDTDSSTDVTASQLDVSLDDATAKAFGSSSHLIQTNIDDLSIDTSAGGGSQFVREVNGLTALNLNAGAGSTALVLSVGSLTDSDTDTDVTASAASITLNDPLTQTIGNPTHPLQTNVDSLTTLNNPASGNGGGQYITEANGLTALNLNASTHGSVDLVVTTGSVTDSDPDADIIGDSANIFLNDPTAANFGAASNPIALSGVSFLKTGASHGNQFLTDDTAIVYPSLSAGQDIVLTLNVGGITAPSPPFLNVFAHTLTVILQDPTAQDFGSASTPIFMDVGALSIDTAAGGGSQFISNGTKLTALDLNAGAGSVSLTQTTGDIFDSDSGTDISAATSTIVISDATSSDFGSAASSINTNVSNLKVDTSKAGGDQFIAQANGLSTFQFLAGTGDVSLDVKTGGVDNQAGADQLKANSATITLDDKTAQNFGEQFIPVNLQVGSISVDTSAGGGSMYLTTSGAVTATSLDAGAGNIDLLGGTFNLAVGDALGDSSSLVLVGTPTVNLASNDETIGGLAGIGNSTINFAADGADHSLTVGGNNRDTSFQGILAGNDVVSGSPVDSFVKVGTGTLTFTGIHTFTGTYFVDAGTLFVDGSLASSSAFAIPRNGGTLGGTGTINRQVTARVDGHVAPGNPTGQLKISGGQLQSGSFLNIAVTSAAAGQFSQLEFSQGLSLVTNSSPGVALQFTKAGTVSLHSGDELVIIKNDGTGSVQGTFAGKPENFDLGDNFLGWGLSAHISYAGGDGNDISIKLSPGSLFPWHNFVRAQDVAGGPGNSADGQVAPNDLTAIISYLNGFGASDVPDNALIGKPFGFLDVKADNIVAPNDLVDVITYLNAFGAGEGESVVNGNASPAASGGLSGDILALLAADAAVQATRPRK